MTSGCVKDLAWHVRWSNSVFLNPKKTYIICLAVGGLNSYPVLSCERMVVKEERGVR